MAWGQTIKARGLRMGVKLGLPVSVDEKKGKGEW